MYVCVCGALIVKGVFTDKQMLHVCHYVCVSCVYSSPELTS